ncbi:transcription initiation factor TFIID subunit 1 [[Candida] railenensis]|uniref:Transcription initiation factor TFIID subunit 1 n=1 Tax=[Candida] railenensis TaxID=45579 RepID=A0A9P0QLJ7_9ASCO|nr:transcription initiation factor TFIID subunit 1 [[Candida] railenensis]
MGRKKNARADDDDDDDLFNQVLSGSTNIMEGGGSINDIYSVKNTEHAADAIDFEDIDELADDDDDLVEDENDPSRKSTNEDADDERANKDAEDMFDDVFGEGEEEKQEQKAEEDFDDIFGDGGDDIDVDKGNDDLFDGLGGQNDGFHDENDELDLQLFDEDEKREVAEEENKEAMSAADERKRKLDLEVERKSAKKARIQKLVTKMEGRLRRKNLSRYFPEYSVDRPYNNHSLFLPTQRYYNYLRTPLAQKSNVKPLIPTKVVLDLEPDQRKAFKSHKDLSNQIASRNSGRVVDIIPSDYAFIQQLKERAENGYSTFRQIPFLKMDGSNDIFGSLPKDLVFSTTSWDDDEIINGGDYKKSNKKLNLNKNITVKNPIIEGIDDIDLEEDEDFDEDIFNGTISGHNKLKLDMNDPNLLFVPDVKAESSGKKTKSKALIPSSEKLLANRFNISNDKQYEVLKKNYNTKVRSQLSNLTIDHSIPAMRLQSPYYKVRLTKAECRSFHRPRFIIRPGTLMNFSKLKVRKKKKDRGKSSQEIFQKTSDLTVSDTAMIVGMEYSEEYPQILSNFGMGSKIINYYRKEKDDDATRPKAVIGETHVLGVEDRSPFWNFGHVARGDFVPTLYNNLIRAPVFKHDIKSTDFLLIRTQGAGNHPRNYLRSMNHVFGVGQLFPAVEVPAPHSRKITNTSKNRLRIVAYRTMNKNGEQRISVKDISSHFPDQNDMQNRQRLKEFMEHQRHGEDSGFWKMKNNEPVPNEDEIRTMITPEDLCLLDSMQHGQQMLEDYIYIFRGEDKDQTARKDKAITDKKEKGEKGEKGEKEKEETENEKETEKEGSVPKQEPKNGKKPNEKERKKRERDDKEKANEEVEEELSSWNLSRNFLNANQTKANLQLNGEGDPTGVGLGFSFLRATQKNTFQPLFGKEDAANGPTASSKPLTAAQSQKIYEDEVSRIWYSQRRSLTVENSNENHNLNTIYSEHPPASEAKIDIKDITDSKSSILKITRRFRDENNIVQRRVSTIKDPILIRAYLKRKKQIEDDLLKNAEVDDIIPTNDKALNKLRKKALEEKLANLKKRLKSGKGRKASKDALHAALAEGGTIIDGNTVLLPDGTYAIGGKGIGKGNSKNRRCTACGAFGHIKTKKSCPLFNQPKPAAGAVTVPPVQQQSSDTAALNSSNSPAPVQQPPPPSMSPPIPQL